MRGEGVRDRIQSQLFQRAQISPSAGQSHEGHVEIRTETFRFPRGLIVAADDQREILGEQRRCRVIAEVGH